MPESIFVPIKTDRLIIDEFKTSDFHRLQEIAFNINHNADVKATEGYCPFTLFRLIGTRRKETTLSETKSRTF